MVINLATGSNTAPAFRTWANQDRAGFVAIESTSLDVSTPIWVLPNCSRWSGKRTVRLFSCLSALRDHPGCDLGPELSLPPYPTRKVGRRERSTGVPLALPR